MLEDIDMVTPEMVEELKRAFSHKLIYHSEFEMAEAAKNVCGIDYVKHLADLRVHHYQVLMQWLKPR